MKSLTVWADPDLPPLDIGNVVLWQAFLPPGAPPTWVSAPDQVAQNQSTYRSEYLAWLHDLGMQERAGVRIVDRLLVRPELSYWWMSVPAGYSLTRGSPAYTTVRIMVLNRLANELGDVAIHLVGGDRIVKKVLGEWATLSGLQFSAEVGPSHANRPSGVNESWRSRLHRVAHLYFPAFLAFRRLADAIRVHGASGPLGRPTMQPDGIVLVNYLTRLAGDEVVGVGRTVNYWGQLPDVLAKAGSPVSWIHIPAKRASRESYLADQEVLDELGGNSPSANHELLYGYLTKAVLARSVVDYLHIVRLGLSLRARSAFQHVPPTGLPLWKVYRESFRDQFYGSTAMLNCLFMNLFEDALAALPQQRLGLYLFENQPWEMTFINAWRRSKHGLLIGVAHSTATYWDTRIFKDPRDLWASHLTAMPWPDAVAVNGPLMRGTCLTAGYPPERLVNVEALRYSHLAEAEPPTRSPGRHRILILGEYSAQTNNHLTDVVANALGMLEGGYVASLRAHPAASDPVEADSRFESDQAPTIQEAMRSAHTLICGATSSSAIDALLSHARLILVRDAEVFSSSPVERLPEARWVSTADELAHALCTPSESLGTQPSNEPEYLNLDPSLTLWRTLVERHTARTATES